MNLPFSAEQFFGVFTRYNNVVWPFHFALYFFAFLSIYLVIKHSQYSNKIISIILGFFWIWMAVVYHWLFFSSINPAAKIFGALFLVQGILFIFVGVVKNKLTFSFEKKPLSVLGIFFIFFGTVIYPILGYFLGHRFPGSPTFGLPCPTTIFTFGILLLTNKLPKYLVIIPLLWSFIGFTAALSLGVKEDVSLLVSGLLAVFLIVVKNEKTI